jgi:post-segregation antitoxin (ccd killing protein)
MGVVYVVRMARVNISMPDDLQRRAQKAGLSVSRLAQQAVAAELERLRKIELLDEELARLEAELGPTSESERAEAADWADRVLGQNSQRRPA